MHTTDRLPCRRRSVSAQIRQIWGAASGHRCLVLMSGRRVLVSNPRSCSQPDWDLMSLLAKVLVQSIMRSPEVATHPCPLPDLLERCPAERRTSLLTCVWSLAASSASAGHPGSMHHWPSLRVQQRTALCSPVSRLLWIASSGWRSGGYTTGAWHQHQASFWRREYRRLFWSLTGGITVNTFHL